MRELIQFIRSNDLKTILAALHSREVHPVIQFFKYCVCGVAGLAVQTFLFFQLSSHVLPALQSNMPSDTVRANNALINSGIALIFSNTLVYLLNVRWVFASGRHSPVREYLYFTAVNAPGVLSGILVQDWLIRALGWPSWAAFCGFVVPNVLINFAFRKLFIFKK